MNWPTYLRCWLDMERVGIAIAGSVVALTAMFSPVWCPSAQAAPLVALCDHREPGHAAKHGGQLADDEYHLRRGESVTCSDDQSHEIPKSDEHKDNDDNGKSRYCRRHFFC